MKIGESLDNRYLIEKELGRGGSGSVVFETVDTITGEKVAVKVFLDTTAIQNNETVFRRFIREIRLIKACNHTNVIKILAENLGCSTPYYVMPIYNLTLKDLFEQTKVNHRLALDILINACKGIQALHDNGVIHRDIKPSNILISDNGDVVISDLGIGVFENRDMTTLTHVNEYLGTTSFIPPEFYKIDGTRNPFPQSDVYQVGKTIYQVFTGEPVDNITYKNLPGGIQFIIQRAISHDIKDRQASIIELQEELMEFLNTINGSKNPFVIFDNFLKDKIIGRYTINGPDIQKILALLYQEKKHPDVASKNFVKLPASFFKEIASKYEKDCQELLDFILPIVVDYRDNYPNEYEDADKFSKVANFIFESTQQINIKVRALALTLLVAKIWNRYDAMDMFCEMLYSFKSTDDISTIISFLKLNKQDYKALADRIKPSKLHPALRAAHNEIT